MGRRREARGARMARAGRTPSEEAAGRGRRTFAASRPALPPPPNEMGSPTVMLEQLPLPPAVLRLDRQEPQPSLHLVGARRRMTRPVVVEVAIHFLHAPERAHEVRFPRAERVLPV